MNPRDLLRCDEAAVLGEVGGRAGRVAVGALVTCPGEKGTRALLLRRVEFDDYGGIEELPSGRMEPGETVLDALRREVAEETGIVVGEVGPHLFDFVYDSRKGPTIQLTFVVPLPEEVEVRLDASEHTESRWVTLAEVDNSALTSAVQAEVRAYLAG